MCLCVSFIFTHFETEAIHELLIVALMFKRLVYIRLAVLITAGPLLGSLHARAETAADGNSSAVTTPAPTRALAQLQQSLALTPQQQGYWQAYLERLEAYTQLHYRTRPAPRVGTETATRQFAYLIDQLQNRLAALEDIENAVVALYASLTPEQRKLADQQLYPTLPVFASAEAGSSRGLPSAEARAADGPPPGRPSRGGPPGGGF